MMNTFETKHKHSFILSQINLAPVIATFLFVCLGLFAFTVKADPLSRADVVAAEKIMDQTRAIRVGTGVITGALGGYAGYAAAAQMALPMPAKIITIAFNAAWGFAAGYGVPTAAMEMTIANQANDVKEDCQTLLGTDRRVDEVCYSWFGKDLKRKDSTATEAKTSPKPSKK